MFHGLVSRVEHGFQLFDDQLFLIVLILLLISLLNLLLKANVLLLALIFEVVIFFRRVHELGLLLSDLLEIFLELGLVGS